MKPNLPRDDGYASRNPVAFRLIEQAVELLTDSGRRVRRFAPVQCRELTIQALESYVRFATDPDTARRLRVTLRHLRGELPVVPLSLS